MRRMILAILLLFGMPAVAAAPAWAESTAVGLWSWEALSLPAGLSMAEVSDLAVSPDDAYCAFLATAAGLYRTTDAGETWVRLAPAMLDAADEVDIPDGDARRIYVRRGSSLHRSDDGGDSWSLVTAPPSFCGLAVAPSAPDRLYAWACWGAQTALFRSDDGGQSWFAPAPAFSPTLIGLVVSPADADLLIAAEFVGLHRSTDGGYTWAALPVGARYNARVAFDPQSPATVYVGHWMGLLRSTDAGQSWQDSDCDREFAFLLVAPWNHHAVLGGETDLTWHVRSDGDTWRATAWSVPEALQGLRRSAKDARVLYALGSSALWRSIYRRPAQAAFLPLVYLPAKPSPFPEVARLALERLNGYRALAGARPLQLHTAAVAAAQNHADYYMLNYNDPTAWAGDTHSEVPGKPGYTGQTPAERMQAAGYPAWGVGEVMHFLDDPILSVDGWLSTVFHRVVVLDARYRHAGYGHGRDAGAAVDVMDLGNATADEGIWTPALPYPLAFPADGQAGVPTSWVGNEYPDPLPPGASRPVGYPFTLQGVRGTIVVTWAELRDGNGNPVAVHPNPSACSAFNCYALIAVSPLQPGMAYTAHVVGHVGGVAFDRTWRFTTGGQTAGVGKEGRLGGK